MDPSLMMRYDTTQAVSLLVNNLLVLVECSIVTDVYLYALRLFLLQLWGFGCHRVGEVVVLSSHIHHHGLYKQALLCITTAERTCIMSSSLCQVSASKLMYPACDAGCRSLTKS